MGAERIEKRGAGHPGADWAVIEWAVQNHSLIHTPRLRELELDRNAVARRVANGRLHPQYPDVYSVGLPSMTKLACFLGCVWACGDNAALSFRSAGHVYEIRPDNRWKVDVTIPHGRKGPAVEQIQIHRSRDLAGSDVTEVHGIPITTWARTVLDLAAILSAGQLQKVLDRSEEHELFDLNALNEQFGLHSNHPGKADLKAALATYAPPHTKSDLEELHRGFLIDRHLPMPQFNKILQGYSREVEADAHWPLDNLVVQLDGWQFHKTRAQRARDADNDAELELAGKRIIRLIWNDFAKAPDRTTQRLIRLTPNSHQLEVAPSVRRS